MTTQEHETTGLDMKALISQSVRNLAEARARRAAQLAEVDEDELISLQARLLAAIADPANARGDVAALYVELLRMMRRLGWSPDAGRVNQAIIARRSVYALEYIKKRVWCALHIRGGVMTDLACSLALWVLVQSACLEFDLPPEPVHALILAESGGDPLAVGALGERGLAQFHEDTFRWLAARYDTGYRWPDDAHDPQKAIRLLCLALDDGRAAHWRGWKRMSFQLVPRRDHRMWRTATPTQLELLGVRP